MAEFREVMKHWGRMCKACQEESSRHGLGCIDTCELAHNDACGYLEYAQPIDIAEAEATIMRWAAENPEPVYPTWREYLMSLIMPYGTGGLVNVVVRTSHYCRHRAEVGD